MSDVEGGRGRVATESEAKGEKEKDDNDGHSIFALTGGEVKTLRLTNIG